ncbi:ester cyclase [Symbioplanes lichenis]|uniref:ester cyclase n=1 Tax=Symbioplanes lichenis TaxID=1629072 RepID=UPI002739F1F7|nr:ester cyclase [Actinoplanes lichenis]
MTQQTTGRAVAAEVLIRGTFHALVPPPAFFALAHFSYQPGAFFPPAEGNGPVVFRVLEGTLEFEAEDAATKTPAGGAPQDMPPGRKFTVTVGDQLVMPGGVLHSARTVGDRAARILGLAVFGAAPAQEFPPGIAFEPLVLGPVGVLPAAPATATVTELRSPPGSRAGVGGAGPRLVHVRAGAVRVTWESGEVVSWRGTGPFAPPVPLTGDAPAELAAGDGLLVQTGAGVSVEGLSEGTVLTVASVGAAGGPGGPDEVDRVVRGYYREVVDAGDVEAAGAWVAAYGRHHDRPEDEQGLAGLRSALRAELADRDGPATTTVEETFGQADVALHRWTRTATWKGHLYGIPVDGVTVPASGLTLSRVRDRQVVEDWEAQDVIEQIGRISGTALLGGLDEGGAEETGARALATRYVADLWHGGDLTLVDELFDPGFVNHTPLPGQQPGTAGVRQFVRRWRTAFPDLTVTVDLLVATPARAAVRWTSRGHHRAPVLGVAASGRFVTVSGITVLAADGGRITDAWQHWAVLSFLAQTGHHESAGGWS